jgi:nucleoside-diphosphate-sugar epimerase
MAERFSVFGARGLVGTRLVETLRNVGHDCDGYGREAWPERGANLGRIIYSIGVTADFRKRPHDTVEAHVGRLSRVLQDYSFDSFTYMSSARVYRCTNGPADEAASFSLPPLDPDKLYDLSKLLGECLCRFSSDPKVRVVRMSNAYAAGDPSPNFLPSVLAEAARTGAVEIRQSSASCKDYIALDDAVAAIIAIAIRGTEPVYNVASGAMVSHGEIAGVLRNCGINVTFAENGPDDIQPLLPVVRLSALLDWSPCNLLDDLVGLMAAARISR